MEVARLFNVMPIDLRRLPVSEYRTMTRYYLKYRESLDPDSDGGSDAPTDGIVIE